jgi:DNA-binding transcriptional regulator YiaG
MFQFTDGGLSNIWLANGYEEIDTPYGSGVSFHDHDGLIRAVCVALTEKKTALSGAEFRYLRQALCLSQSALGDRMDKTDQAIAKWEKSAAPVPRLADFAMRTLYLQHANGDQAIKDLVTALNATERTLHIVMRETPRGWRHTEQEAQPASAGA